MNGKMRALVCRPSDTIHKGLRMKERGVPDAALAKRQHDRYCQALRNFGYSLVVMQPDDRHPDSVFVEDPGIILNGALIVTRLRCKERRGEEVEVLNALQPYFRKIARIEEPGFIEGGDVLVAHDSLYIGLSARTDSEGAEQLTRLAWDLARYKSHVFPIPDEYLHLKGEVTFHKNSAPGGKHFLTISEEIADRFSGSGYELLVTPAEERFGGNCISCGMQILVHAGRPRTKRLLDAMGFTTIEINISEFEKIDGAMTCLSKLF